MPEPSKEGADTMTCEDPSPSTSPAVCGEKPSRLLAMFIWVVGNALMRNPTVPPSLA